MAGLAGQEVEQRATNLLELVDLGDRLHHKPLALSGGEQQRTAIAVALANEPRLL
jgi:predicted ABC-type transport system involved in lysophospholipase L1 biosynthesis ATPase subunit